MSVTLGLFFRMCNWRTCCRAKRLSRIQLNCRWLICYFSLGINAFRVIRFFWPVCILTDPHQCHCLVKIVVANWPLSVQYHVIFANNKPVSENNLKTQGKNGPPPFTFVHPMVKTVGPPQLICNINIINVVAVHVNHIDAMKSDLRCSL